MVKIVVIGMNPGANPLTKKPRKNSTFYKLNNWMDAIGVNHYSFMNTFDEPGAVPRKEKVDVTRFSYIDDGYTVLALGLFVSTTLNRLGIDHYRLPHPSPRNHLFNDKEYEKNVVKELKEHLKGMRT